jgi:hypothetical protein
MPSDLESACALLTNMDGETRKRVAEEAAKPLSADQRLELARRIAFPDPGAKVRDVIWIMVIAAFSLVLVGSFATIAIAMFRGVPKDAAATPELVLSMFTSVIGFLAGLFVPSPIGRGIR